MPRRGTHDFLHGEITASIIGCMQESHSELGFGYREHIYSLALEQLLVAKGHRVDRELAVMVYFRGQPLATQVLDMIVGGKVAVELKTGEALKEAATGQLFVGYLCATMLEVGLALHFGRTARAHRVFFENKFKKHLRKDSETATEIL
ncbi:MAG TPA: GxxExxY protein [Gemmatimonadaceae bacterium]|jgi:GxxExxY protein|nr:GxxExxY protein [Gemmatimonadaceae bacterium]